MMLVALKPYRADLAAHVLMHLDPYDQREAELVRGRPAQGLELFSDWHAGNAFRAASFVACWGVSARPFAVLGLSNTGVAGVGQAALLACDHAKHRRALAMLAITLRAEFPAWCVEHQVQRVECRSWAQHPTAASLLDAIGFHHEAEMPGFGAAGRTTFHQFSWTQGDLPCACRLDQAPVHQPKQ